MAINTKYICLCLTLLFSITANYAQEDFKTKELPFSFGFSYLGDVVTNMVGGIQTGGTYLGMANVTLQFDTEKARLWKGGQLFVNGANTHGGEPSVSLIGDFQVVSNIEAGDLTYLHELWFKQSFNKFSFILGLQDLNAEFASSDFGGLYLNSSFGVHSTIADNIPAPIFPLTRLGATFIWKISDKFNFKVAVFDGLRAGYENNDYNTNWDLNTEEGFIGIGEISINKVSFSDKPGIYKLGFYTHQYNRQLPDSQKSNNMGVYIVADQLVYKHSFREGGIGFFTQLGLSKSNINNHFAYFGLGINVFGISSKRCNDELGLALAHTWFKTNASGNETAIELNYKAVLGEHFFVQPDLQYIINPAGTDNALNNAFVGILRFGVSF